MKKLALLVALFPFVSYAVAIAIESPVARVFSLSSVLFAWPIAFTLLVVSFAFRRR